ncbi:hypothetical protein HGRIS_012783 [Hohenbuehelia grisea]|uniref:S-adenosyl-L-methionine-dependent methyltransferase n=1 Tax=Hohenbuehelia grisea TaxID=104357 RepID=A0ABR3ITE0_9AGAR
MAYNSPSELLELGDDDSSYYRWVHGRALNSLNPRYMLPVDADAIKRSEFHHRMLQFLFNGKNYVGPVKEVLQPSQQRRVLDLGTGGGFWAIDMADEFPRAEVIGVDLAPIQPRSVPPNCTFELCDLDQWNLPYPDNHFDLIHARSMHTGIHNYPRLLHEIGRLLRPGGLVILIEPDLIPIVDGKPAPQLTDTSSSQGWLAFWDTYRACLVQQGIDVTVPSRLPELLAATNIFQHVVTQDGNIPIGFYPPDQLSLTVGQFAWMDYDLLIPATKPLFLTAGLPESKVKRLIKDAHHDLYYPQLHCSSLLHIVHAFKRQP